MASLAHIFDNPLSSASRPHPGLEDQTFSVILNCLFNKFTATLNIWGAGGHFLHLKREDLTWTLDWKRKCLPAEFSREINIAVYTRINQKGPE
jgi:hypothetical protein